MASITLDSDLYAEKFTDDYEKVQHNCQQIRNICKGKDRMSPFILLGYIHVALSAWGIVGTYHQTKPISTTANMIQQLLAEGSIDEDLVIQFIANDESERETAREELKILTNKCSESQAEFKTAFERFDTLYPYAVKILIRTEQPLSQERRPWNRLVSYPKKY